MTFIGLLLVLIIVAGAISLRIAQEYQRCVIFRFGRVVGIRGPGLFFLIPLAERSVTVGLRTITRELETQETVTRDGVFSRMGKILGIGNPL